MQIIFGLRNLETGDIYDVVLYGFAAVAFLLLGITSRLSSVLLRAAWTAAAAARVLAVGRGFGFPDDIFAAADFFLAAGFATAAAGLFLGKTRGARTFRIGTLLIAIPYAVFAVLNATVTGIVINVVALVLGVMGSLFWTLKGPRVVERVVSSNPKGLPRHALPAPRPKG